MHLEYGNGYLVGAGGESFAGLAARDAYDYEGREAKLRVWKLSEEFSTAPASAASPSRSGARHAVQPLVEHGIIDCQAHPFRALRMIGDELVTAGTQGITIYGG